MESDGSSLQLRDCACVCVCTYCAYNMPLPFTQHRLPLTASAIHKDPLGRALHSRAGCMNADAAVRTWAHAEIASGRFSESVHAAVETAVPKIEACVLKTAT